jgi:hypothetical protein
MTIITQNRWNVRIVPVGQVRGASDSLINTQKEPMIEFFDGLNANGREGVLGQFVQSYFLSTLLKRDMAHGLDLYASVPEWKVSRDDMIQITHELHTWANTHLGEQLDFVIAFHFEDDAPMMKAVQATNVELATIKLLDMLSVQNDEVYAENESIFIDQIQTFTTLKADILV